MIVNIKERGCRTKLITFPAREMTVRCHFNRPHVTKVTREGKIKALRSSAGAGNDRDGLK